MDTNELEAKQILVVVPGALVNHTGLARTAAALAQRHQATVQYLALACNGTDLMDLPNRIQVARSIPGCTWAVVTGCLHEVSTWRKAAEELCYSHDLIVLASEQNILAGQLHAVPVSEVLSPPKKTYTRPIQPPAHVLRARRMKSAGTRVEHFTRRLMAWMSFWLS